MPPVSQPPVDQQLDKGSGAVQDNSEQVKGTDQNVALQEEDNTSKIEVKAEVKLKNEQNVEGILKAAKTTSEASNPTKSK